MHTLVNRLITFTETVLTYRKKRKYIKQEREKSLHPVLDWLYAFLWAVGVVLLLNQFLFQAYVIPSRSMENTLLVGDRIFVNKLVYGPEILPGTGKINGNIKPKVGDVVIFENPDYIKKGSFFDLSQRIIYMLTLSMIDIDKDVNGDPAHHFFIKRLVASDGDLVKVDKGDIYIKSEGEDDYILEEEYMELNGLTYFIKRDIDKNRYKKFNSNRRLNIFYETIGYGKADSRDYVLSDNRENILINNKYLSQVSPSNTEYFVNFNIEDRGFYIPSGWVLPLGDNRDNSYDGRYFGPIEKKEVLGRASLKFWPFNRLDKVR